MRVTGEGIKVDPTAVAPDGTKLEPEERSAIEAFQTPVETHLSDHAVIPGSAPTDGAMRGVFGNEKPAGEMAQDMATRCALCQHWRQDDYQRHLVSISDTRDGQEQIERLRGMLLGLRKPNENPDDDLASEVISTAKSIDPHDLIAVNIAIKNDFGICAAFTESLGMVSISPYYGGCPEGDARFKVRDRGTRIVASARYDQVLRLAQGRKE